MKHALLALIASASLAAGTQDGTGAPPKAPPATAPSVAPADPSTPPTKEPAPSAPPVAPTPTPAPAPAPAPATPPENLPSAADIFKRGVAAIGGEDVVRRHTSMHLQCRLSVVAMGMEGPMEIFMLAPNRFLTTIDMPGTGRMEQGFDGTVGWSKNQVMGTQLIQGKALEELRRNSDFFKDADPSRLWPTANTVGVTDFAGHRCHEVAVKGDMGEGSLFFDVDGGLQRGMRLSMDTPMGKVPTITRYMEYTSFDGLQVASVSEIEAMGAVQTMTVEKVDFDPLDAKLFEQPPDVKALVASGKTSAPPKEPAGAKPGSGDGSTGAPSPKPGKPKPGTPKPDKSGGTPTTVPPPPIRTP